MVFLRLASMLLLFMSPWAWAWAADGDARLDVRLMTDADTKAAATCGLRLWQKDRNPSTDRFAFAFAMPVTPDAEANEAGPGNVKIGRAIESLTRIAVGGKAYGPIRQHQVFRKTGADLTVMIDLLEFSAAGDGLEIYDARVTVYDSNRLPFPVRVVGAYYCQAASAGEAVASPSIALTKVTDITSWKQVPPAVLSEARNQDDCDHDSLGTVWGTLYKVSETRQIWEIPCFLGAYQGSMVYVYQVTDQADSLWLMTFQSPETIKQDGDADQPWLMEPRLDIKTGIVTSLELGRAAADCGKYQRHRLVAGDGDSHAFELIEFREKPDCDEVFIPVEEFPLVYPK